MAKNMEGENNIIEIYMCGGGSWAAKLEMGLDFRRVSSQHF